MALLSEPDELRRVLEENRVIAVLGARDKPAKAAYFVPDYLHGQGYRVIAVNPRLVGQTLWGEPVHASLGDIEGPVDLVNVFRRSEAVPGHRDEILAMTPRPRVVWLQRGVEHDETARALSAAGIDVVQGRCIKANHARLEAEPRS